MEFKNLVIESFQESVEIKGRFIKEYSEKIVDLSNKITKKIREGGGIFFIGNGGSAADAAHLTAELIGMFYKYRKPIRALSLATNPSILTEIPNDFGFKYLFERQIEAHVTPKDTLIGISTSGKSANIIHGLKKAKAIGALTVGLTGKDIGEMDELCDIILKVDSKKVPRIQEVHILLGHIVCQLIEIKLFGGD